MRTWLGASAVLLAVLVTASLALAQAPTTDDTAVRTAEDDETAVGPATAADARQAREADRRAAMRKVAWASLGMILLLIIFVVVVMILNRRMRMRYLGWDRKITFNKLWDVWWTKTDDKSRDKPGKPDAGR